MSIKIVVRIWNSIQPEINENFRSVEKEKY